MAPALGFVALLALVLNVGAQMCNVTSPCGAGAPCCSQYGYCGGDSFCLGGCNPFASSGLNTNTSCMPEPICQNANHTFFNASRIAMDPTSYTGDASAYDWTLDSGNITTNSTTGELVLLLNEANGGTRLSSTRYVHYGTMTARLKTGRWGGVVTAFITMSDIRDEIDWEFPGNQTSEGQTNYFWQGVIPPTTQGGTTNNLTNTYSNYHDYTIDWHPDNLTWLVDNQPVRVVLRNTTIDRDGISHYPSTPSRIQISIWPAGISSSESGTVQWAGGMINWSDPDYLADDGHFYASFQSVSIQCADPLPPSSLNATSYIFGPNTSMDNPSIFYSYASTITSSASGPALRADSYTVAIFVGTIPLILTCALTLNLF